MSSGLVLAIRLADRQGFATTKIALRCLRPSFLHQIFIIGQQRLVCSIAAWRLDCSLYNRCHLLHSCSLSLPKLLVSFFSKQSNLEVEKEVMFNAKNS